MNFVKTLNRFAGLGLMLATLAGCHNDGGAQAVKNHAEEFAPEDDTRASVRLMDAQIVTGARADMTLYSSHFDGPGLNSLGTRKLDLVLRDSSSMNPLVVYLSITNDKYALDHRSAVTNYLVDRGGLRPEQVKFENGSQPENLMPAKEGLDALARQQAADSSGGSSGGAPSAGASH